MKAKNPGFALVMALFVIALGSVLVTSLLQKAVAYDRLHRVLLVQQQARMLALNGLEIARAQLSNPLKLSDAKDEKPVDHNISPFLYTDQVQTFSFSEEKEGIGGITHLYITAEVGKINLNRAYDVIEKKYVVGKGFDGQQVIALLNEAIQKNFTLENFSQVLPAIFQKRNKPFEDVTELLSHKIAGEVFMPLNPLPKEACVLTDIFTLASPAFLLQPLYLSRSLAGVLELGRQDLTKSQRLEIIKKISSVKGAVNWAFMWKELLAPLYKKEYTVLPDVIKKSLSPKIEVSTFCVVSYGRVAGVFNVTQKLCAYIEKTVSKETQQVSYTVKRLYWL